MEETIASSLESVETCITALQRADQEEREVSALAETWNGFKSCLKEVFTRHREEVTVLQRKLRKVEFEKTSAENHAEGLKKELREMSRSLVQMQTTSSNSSAPETVTQTWNLESQASLEQSLATETAKPQSHDMTGTAETERTSRDLGMEVSASQNAGLEPENSGMETQESAKSSTDVTMATSDVTTATTDAVASDDYQKMEPPSSSLLLTPPLNNSSKKKNKKPEGGTVSYDGYLVQPHPPLHHSSFPQPLKRELRFPVPPPGSHTHTTTAGQTSGIAHTTATSQAGGIAAMLAAASDNVTQRCGYTYDETIGMYYDKQLGVYYDQDSQLYYDAVKGTYYSYDQETRQYQFHSKVIKAPPKKPDPKPREEVIDLCSSEEEEDSPVEEGEIRLPKLPPGSPPPEEEWAPAIRMVVTSSEVLDVGTLFVVTQDGVTIGREASGPNAIKIPEVQVSKQHAEISYSRRRRTFAVVDVGSRNGTILNEKKIRKSRESHPLSHGDTLALGTSSFILHIHTGLETCEECDPALREEGTARNPASDPETLDLQRRKELNRIKKKFGLRTKDTYGKDDVQIAEGYKDRATKRRKTVGSDPPEVHYPDAPPSSVHRPLSGENKGRKLLKKMGWKEGEGLGKDNAGITQPVLAEVRDERTGLGSAYSKRGMDNMHSTDKHQKMLKHFAQVVSREQKKSSKPY